MPIISLAAGIRQLRRYRTPTKTLYKMFQLLRNGHLRLPNKTTFYQWFCKIHKDVTAGLYIENSNGPVKAGADTQNGWT
jgi:hypothetical protein